MTKQPLPASNPAALLEAVLQTNETTRNPRLKEVMAAAIRRDDVNAWAAAQGLVTSRAE